MWMVFGNREGWTAQQLFDQLIQDEFAQTGGLLPLNHRIRGGRATPPHLTAELFARSVLLFFFLLQLAAQLSMYEWQILACATLAVLVCNSKGCLTLQCVCTAV